MDVLKSFLWLLPIIYTPAAAVAAFAVFSVQAALSSRTQSRWIRVAVAAAALTVDVFAVAFFGPLVIGERPGILTLHFVSELRTTALLPFGIVVPWLASTTYCVRTPRPSWWRSGLIGVAGVVAGALLWLALAGAVGAESD